MSAEEGDAAAAGRMPRRAGLLASDSLFFKLVRVVNLTARPFSESIGQAHHLTRLEVDRGEDDQGHGVHARKRSSSARP